MSDTRGEPAGDLSFVGQGLQRLIAEVGSLRDAGERVRQLEEHR
ncbi:MAG: hypothetical protein ACREFB_01575 [Stellaceae bacterium]